MGWDGFIWVYHFALLLPLRKYLIASEEVVLQPIKTGNRIPNQC